MGQLAVPAACITFYESMCPSRTVPWESLPFDVQDQWHEAWLNYTYGGPEPRDVVEFYELVSPSRKTWEEQPAGVQNLWRAAWENFNRPSATPLPPEPFQLIDARKTVGLVVKRARRAKGCTAERAAQQAGIAQKTWARVENGEQVRSQSLISMATQMGLPQDALLAALSRDSGYVDLAKALNVAVPSATPSDSPIQLIEQAAALLTQAVRLLSQPSPSQRSTDYCDDPANGDA